MSSIDSFVKVYPREWPEDKELELYPGDLEKFAVPGVGISGPFPIRPWGNPLEDDPSDFYSFQRITGHPIKDASKNEPTGGVLYFGGTPRKEDIEALYRLLNVRTHLKDYAAFVEHSLDPVEDRYLVQMRIVSRFALKYLFRALDGDDYESFPAQKRDIGEVLWQFIEDQQDTWGTGMNSYNIRGTMGGDGDFAKEELAFGFMVENEYHSVYRIWSRAWLVTK